MLTLIRQSTGEALFSSNSIYGMLDLLLMNWGPDPNFHLVYDQDVGTLTVNGVDYSLQYHALGANPRGEVLISE